MIAPPGGRGSFGGRPPVNIETNFVPGAGKSAFAIAREENAALQKELKETQGMIDRMGRGGAGGMGGGGVRGNTSNERFNNIGGTFSAQSVFLNAARAQEATAAANRISAAHREIETSARKAVTETVALNSALGQTAQRMAMRVPGGGMAAGLATSAAGAMGGLAGASVGLPLTLAGGLLGLAAINTPQGEQAVGGFGHYLGSTAEAYTRRGGFLDNFIGNITPGPVGYAAQLGRYGLDSSYGLGPFRDEARTARQLADTESRAAQRRNWAMADDARFQLGFSGELQSSRLMASLDGTLSGAQAGNARERAIYESRLSATANGDPQSGYMLQGEARANALGGLIENRQQEIQLATQAHEATTATWRTVLESQTKIMELRAREVQLVEKQVNARTAGYAEQSPGQLRALERAYRDATDGDGQLSRRNRSILNRDGSFGDLPELQRANREQIEKYAPNIAARLQQPLIEAKAALEASQQSVEDFSEQMAEIMSKSAGQVKAIADAAKKAIEELDKQRLEAMQEMIDEVTAQRNTTRNSQTQSPGG